MRFSYSKAALIDLSWSKERHLRGLLANHKRRASKGPPPLRRHWHRDTVSVFVAFIMPHTAKAQKKRTIKKGKTRTKMGADSVGRAGLRPSKLATVGSKARGEGAYMHRSSPKKGSFEFFLFSPTFMKPARWFIGVYWKHETSFTSYA